jgi:mono/diheme cytochrome c family protein
MTPTGTRRAPRGSRRRATPLVLVLVAAAAVAGCGREDAPDVVNGKRLFTGEGRCGSCHILARAGTGGTIGPNLDQAFLASRLDGLGERTIQDIVQGQIDEPLNDSLMPEDLVVGQDARDVAAYVAQAAGKPGEDPGGTVAGNPLARPGQEGKQIFNAAGCASCHALSDAGSSAAVGPSLDDAARGSGGGLAPREWLRQSIVDPNAILAGGYPRDLMPDDYGRRLNPRQVEALVDYLMRVGNR